jgi:hypothetical protein
MRNRTVMGIFDRPSDAEKVKDELLEAGIARHRISISQPHENQKVEAGGACLLAVVARSPVDREHIARLMLRHGARETLESRA